VNCSCKKLIFKIRCEAPQKKIHTEGIDFVKMEIQQAENYPETNGRGKRLWSKKKEAG